MLKPSMIALLLLAGTAFAQQQAPPPQNPQVRLNYLNVCSPSEEDQKQIAAALARLPGRPQFAEDFEISRGRSSMTDSSLFAAGEGAQMNTGQPSVSRWVRLRKEFPEKSSFTNVQYSFSASEGRAVETLVFRLRDVKDLLLISISDSVDVAGDPGAVARVSTPADRVRLERFGKSSITLARCREADQAKYEPLFQSASKYLDSYRALLRVSDTVPAELKRVPSETGKSAAMPKAPAAKTAPERKP